MATFDSASYGAAIAPSDSTIIPPTRGIYVGGTGNVVIKDMAGNIVTYNAVPAGVVLPVQCTQVLAASTATLMTAMW